VNSERARLFVALELPGEVREALVVWRDRALAGVSGLRAVSPSSLHVTLCFLGSVAVTEVDVVWEACRVALLVGGTGSAPPPLVLGAAVWLPARRPRVLAVSLGNGTDALAHAQALISGALVSGGWYRPEPRPFLAHVTVARVGRGGVVRAVELPVPPAISFVGSTVTLFRSHLGRGGARYEALRSVAL
jgi:2'-5' RNA ligase